MTRIMSLVLLTALATTPALAQTSRGGTAAAGGGDAMIWWYDEDENGDPADGMVEMECLGDD